MAIWLTPPARAGCHPATTVIAKQHASARPSRRGLTDPTVVSDGGRDKTPRGGCMSPAIVVETRDGVVHTAVERFERLAQDAISARGRFSCALPGGSVAEAMFPAIARLPLSWEHVHVFFGDERAVPPTDPASNYGLAPRPRPP